MIYSLIQFAISVDPERFRTMFWIERTGSQFVATVVNYATIDRTFRYGGGQMEQQRSGVAHLSSGLACGLAGTFAVWRLVSFGDVGVKFGVSTASVTGFDPILLRALRQCSDGHV
ncbi:hypothetical protein Tco_1546889 [Tanacetum coccineum]